MMHKNFDKKQKKNGTRAFTLVELFIKSSLLEQMPLKNYALQGHFLNQISNDKELSILSFIFC